MKHKILLFTFLCLFTLTACSLNTKFDDDEYRPVGASTPINSQTHTLSKTHQPAAEQESEAHAESVATRYIQPDTENITEIETKKSISSDKENIITRTINNVFNSRYGDSDVIIKISKTVHIHCDQPKIKPLENNKPSKNKTLDSYQMTVCEYQFPEHCGAHIFSLITNKNKQLLMFHDNSYQRNIIDTISADKLSAPGLWDKDDFVSSELFTVNQLITNKPIDANDLGWIMTVSDNEKSQLGRSYLAAINETSKCF